MPTFETKTDHLSTIPGAVLMVWLNHEDVQAVRLEGGTEALFIDGRRVNLTARHWHPSQAVINLAHQSGRERRKSLDYYRAL